VTLLLWPDKKILEPHGGSRTRSADKNK
jgi:hypothetical protein